MTYKIKISLAAKFSFTFASLFLATMLAVIFAVRGTVIAQFTNQYERAVSYSLQSIQRELLNRHAAIKQQLQHLADKMAKDNDFLLRVMVRKEKFDPFIIDYAKSYMSTMGLQALEIADRNGIVLSSGQNRNSFGKNIGSLLNRLRENENQVTLSQFESAQKTFVCLTALKTVHFGKQRFTIIGGLELNTAFLNELKDNPNQIILVKVPNSVLSTTPGLTTESVPFLATENDTLALPGQFENEYSMGRFQALFSGKQSTANVTFYLLQPKSELFKLLARLNMRILATAGFGLALAILLAIWLTRSVAKPLTRLAKTAGALTLDSYDAKFEVHSNDEVGVLGSALTSMLNRLRQNRMQLAVAEKKAAFAQIARQVNHDIKNGFVPIRHVMKHWLDVAKNEPENLAGIFNERQSTVMESIDYMEKLARSYARFKPQLKLQGVSVNGVIRNLVRNYETLLNARVKLHTSFDASDPVTCADEIQLYRAYENILQNALDAIAGNGEISITTKTDGDRITIIWKDNGRGIPEAVQEQLFKPHVTTKPEGSGLGLVNVKSIMEDFGGSIKITSRVGSGTTVVLTLPVMKKSS